MHFLLQKDIWNEPGYSRLLDSIKQRSTSEVVELIPFTTDFVQPVKRTPDVVFGSGRFVDVCRSKGYPVFNSFSPDHTFYPASLWLNAEGEYRKLKDIRIEHPVFLKPKREKFFTGLVVHAQEDLEKIQFTSSDDDGEEWIWVSAPAAIEEEIRFFVIQGKAVTASQYKRGGITRHQPIPSNHPAWPFVESVLIHGAVDDAFVMDVCFTAAGWFIVELNNFNSSGFYECDTGHIVEALEKMHVSRRSAGSCCGLDGDKQEGTMPKVFPYP